jgi:hypothetical protein
MWVPPEIKDPVLLPAPTRKSVACFGAVSLRTGTFIRSLCATFNAVTFETVLKRLLRHRAHGTRMVLALDNARYHHAVLLKPVLRTYRAVLTLLFLPPYSPQLAPHRARLEAGPPPGDAQPLLRHPERRADRRLHMLRPLENAQFGATEIMRHNLRRYV